MRLFERDIVGGIDNRYLVSGPQDRRSVLYSPVFNRSAQGVCWLCARSYSEEDTLNMVKLFSATIMPHRRSLGMIHPIIGVLGRKNAGKTPVASGIINLKDDFELKLGERNRFLKTHEGKARPRYNIGTSDFIGQVVWADLIHSSMRETGHSSQNLDPRLATELQSLLGGYSLRTCPGDKAL